MCGPGFSDLVHRELDELLFYLHGGQKSEKTLYSACKLRALKKPPIERDIDFFIQF